MRYNPTNISVLPLGQSGFRFQYGSTTLYVDPYLSDSVEELEGQDMARCVPIVMRPAEIHDADWALATHFHVDHADPGTLIPLSKASPRCRFLCPAEVARDLTARGIASARIAIAREQRLELAPNVHVTAVPAAHTAVERDPEGFLRFVGYVIDFGGRLVYHAGDTSPSEELIRSVQALGQIDVAFLPVNERNFYRDRRGIVGNMTLREAFALAEEIGARTVVPMHWDMFAPNTVDRREIELFYEVSKPAFTMAINPNEI